METTMLMQATAFRNKILKRTGEKVFFEKYSDHFYLKAVDDYALGGHR
jgi:hypothetical protein